MIKTRIKTRIIKEPTDKTIEIKCPSCKALLTRTVHLNRTKGITTCYLSHTVFEWEEIK